MRKTFVTLFDEVDQPLLEWFDVEDEWQATLRRETLESVDQPQMMSTPEQMQFIAWLIRSIDAKKAIEVGVYTGYGSLWIARALPEDGYLLACDNSETWPKVGIPYWKKAGLEHKIDLQIAPAIETLQTLLDEGHAEQFDFIFIDADKIHYPDYFKYSHRLLRAGGILVFDNVVWVGEHRVVKSEVPATRGVKALLEVLSKNHDYECSLIPISMGMLLARKVSRGRRPKGR